MWSLGVFSAIALLSTTLSTVSLAALSMDGSCGGTTGYECFSAVGNCCGGSGWCGNSTSHCGAGCDPKFGTCGPKLTLDGTCGGTNGFLCHSQVGNCCSDHGYCGNTTAHCGLGCQDTFSVTGTCITGVKPTVDGSCGAAKGLTCTGSAFNGQCCSPFGYCGTSASHCGTGCQPGYGSGCAA